MGKKNAYFALTLVLFFLSAFVVPAVSYDSPPNKSKLINEEGW